MCDDESQAMVPILDKVSVALKDKIQVVNIDTQKYSVIADKFMIITDLSYHQCIYFLSCL